MANLEDNPKEDLRKLLFELYMKNNPRLEHAVYIYTYNGVVDNHTNPFQYVSAKLPNHVKKSLILQNIASGEMIQAFIAPVSVDGQTHIQLENTIIYGNKNGMLVEIGLTGEKIGSTVKYRQFIGLVKSILRQFV